MLCDVLGVGKIKILKSGRFNPQHALLRLRGQLFGDHVDYLADALLRRCRSKGHESVTQLSSGIECLKDRPD